MMNPITRSLPVVAPQYPFTLHFLLCALHPTHLPC